MPRRWEEFDDSDNEGWGEIRPGDRRAHYYLNTMSLCGRVGFYRGRLWPETIPSPDDHKECRTILEKRQALRKERNEKASGGSSSGT